MKKDNLSAGSTAEFCTNRALNTLMVRSLYLFLTLVTVGISSAQTTESLAVGTLAPDTPEWLEEAVKAEAFREDKNTTAVESKPFGESATGRATVNGPVYSQPAGALTGKVVYTMAGHGWTYDSDRMYYYTQRGLSHGMVEDMGNADQMHIFAHMVFNAGATVVPLKPVDYQPNERILDNQMPQVEFYGPWKMGSAEQYFGNENDEVPYAFAEASLQESAVARYRPYIPETGYYPVYVWARDGDDRSNQLYRIAHSGGMAEVRVDWRKVGKTWIWLGTYHFNQGDAGYVETSNQVIDPYEAYQGNVVVADAVRFGNGRGDVPRPGGISGFNREDEGDSYWLERGLGVNADRRLFDVGRDGSSTISSPPKAAAYTNRETEGSYLDRVLVSFHSNASSGKARGAVALFNASAQRRPSYQESFAEILGHEVNRQMTAETPPAEDKWSPRERNTYSGINFGELRRDYLRNEMVATIVETAFHDNAADVDFLLNPTSRMQMAQATLRGLLRWYAEIAFPNSSFTLPPFRPVAVSATVDNGRILVKWKTGEAGEFAGGPATRVKIYRSSNGYGFDGGILTDVDAESFTVDPVTTETATFIRVTALNAAGESFPSQTVAVYAGREPGPKSGGATNLVLAPTNVLDATANVPYKLDKQAGGPYKEGAQTQRVRAVYALWEPTAVGEATALAALGEKFNGATATALTADIAKLSGMKRVFYVADSQNPGSPLLGEGLRTAIRRFVEDDGKLYIAGFGIAENIKSQGNEQSGFLRDSLGVLEVDKSSEGAALQSTDPRFLPTTTTISLSQTTNFWDTSAVLPAAFVNRKDRSLDLLQYSGRAKARAAAVLTRPTTSDGEIFLLGFPLSLVANENDRLTLMQALLKQM